MKVRRAASIAVATAALLGGAVQAQPQAQPQEAQSLEARCLALGVGLSQNADPKAQQLGQLILNFFMGRISGQGKSVDLQKAIAAAKEETKDGIAPLRDKCGEVQKAATSLVIVPPAPASPAPTAP